MAQQTRLSYCTNVFPQSDWGTFESSLKNFKNGMKDPVGFGLWISALNLKELRGYNLPDFILEDLKTLNAFPMGAFHSQRVKEQVYQPDWSQPERLDYTCQLLSFLAPQLAKGTYSVSTLPLGEKRELVDNPKVISHLLKLQNHLEELREQYEVHFRVAFEPEPFCCFENMDQIGAFLSQHPELNRDFFGLCLDICHQSVLFLKPEEVLQKITEWQIPLIKVQISNAPRWMQKDPLWKMWQDDEVYLHQTFAQSEGTIQRYYDAPASQPPGEVRMHYHIPVHWEEGTCREDVKIYLDRLKGHSIDFEIETYTYSRLKSLVGQGDRESEMQKEIEWVLEHLLSA